MSYPLSPEFARGQRRLYAVIVVFALAALGAFGHVVYALATGNRCFDPAPAQEIWHPVAAARAQ